MSPKQKYQNHRIRFSDVSKQYRQDLTFELLFYLVSY